MKLTNQHTFRSSGVSVTRKGSKGIIMNTSPQFANGQARANQHIANKVAERFGNAIVSWEAKVIGEQVRGEKQMSSTFRFMANDNEASARKEAERQAYNQYNLVPNSVKVTALVKK